MTPSLFLTACVRTRRGPGAAAYADMVNESIWEVMARSIITTLLTLMPVICLLLFGGETLKDFAFALLVGILSGAYSSIFVAAPLLDALERTRAALQGQGWKRQGWRRKRRGRQGQSRRSALETKPPAGCRQNELPPFSCFLSASLFPAAF